MITAFCESDGRVAGRRAQAVRLGTLVRVGSVRSASARRMHAGRPPSTSTSSQRTAPARSSPQRSSRITSRAFASAQRPSRSFGPKPMPGGYRPQRESVDGREAWGVSARRAVHICPCGTFKRYALGGTPGHRALPVDAEQQVGRANVVDLRNVSPCCSHASQMLMYQAARRAGITRTPLVGQLRAG